MKLSVLCLALIISTSAKAEAPEPSSTLRAIAAADARDRDGPPSTLDAPKIAPRDAERRRLVKEIMSRGEVRAAEDFFNAALIFQHGETPDDFRLAYALVTIASAMTPDRIGPKAAACSAWDRLLVSLGRPQWYGTQFIPSKVPGKFELAPVDETAVTDEERKSRGVPILQESRENAARFN